MVIVVIVVIIVIVVILAISVICTVLVMVMVLFILTVLHPMYYALATIMLSNPVQNHVLNEFDCPKSHTHDHVLSQITSDLTS